MHPKHLLARHHIDPKRSLGQNFLYDDQVLARIAGAAELAPADNVLEIGPGVGALTQHLAAQAGRAKPSLMVMTVQKEVAERVSARPGAMSLLAVSVQFYGPVEIVGSIKAGAFWPRPDVDSAIIRIDLRQGPLLSPADEAAFFRLVKAGFSQKRKQLQKNLRVLGYPREQINALLAAANIDGQRRAETLSLAEWAALLEASRQIS